MILVVGSVAYDNLETPAGKRDNVLGGAAVHFSTAASFFSQVAMVGVVGPDFEDQHITFLRSRGIDTSGIVVNPQGKTFRWSGHYLNDINHAETLATELGVFASFEPKLSSDHAQTSHLFLANIHPRIQASVLDQMPVVKFVAMDTMNYWITTAREDLQKVIKRVDAIFVNDMEAKMLTHQKNVMNAAAEIMNWGPKVVIIKRGEHGALLFTKDFVFSAPGMPLGLIVDPTGAGDSFAGGFMGYLARSGNGSEEHLRRAAVFGSVMASFQVQDFGLDRMRTLTTADIEQRLKQFKTLSDFSGHAVFG
ncbi:MAG: sugar kinase [Deltaproteobacteria bacterium]|nr:sugar kinase [Deltaproteobacteria bacterium]